jgi:hypothetical protein
VLVDALGGVPLVDKVLRWPMDVAVLDANNVAATEPDVAEVGTPPMGRTDVRLEVPEVVLLPGDITEQPRALVPSSSRALDAVRDDETIAVASVVESEDGGLIVLPVGNPVESKPRVLLVLSAIAGVDDP